MGSALPPALVARLGQRDLEQRLGIALPLVTLDPEGRPHPMLVSYLELRAHDDRTVGLVVQAESRSARNLVERRVATLIVVEPDVIVYVKLRRVDGPLPIEGGEPFGLGYIMLEVEQVLEDTAAAWESGMRITGATRYAPAPGLAEPWVQATLAALASPRARA